MIRKVDMKPDRYCYEYPRPAVTVDAVVMRKNKEVLLIRRKNPPFEGCWALPGGFVDEDETLEQALLRETAEETGIILHDYKLAGVYSNPKRDPRHRTITVVYASVLDDEQKTQAGDDAKELGWFAIEALPDMAFDHGQIVHDVMRIFSNDIH